MGLILLIAAILIGLFLIPLGLLYGFIHCFWKHHIGIAFANLDSKFRTLAVALDIYGNAICPELLTDTLITKGSTHPFGLPGETISLVVAANQKSATLTPAGKGLARILTFFRDPAFLSK